jgi:acetyl esterase/lipase
MTEPTGRRAHWWQNVGLALINLIARSVRSQVETIAFGEDARQQLDWYRPAESAPTDRPVVIFFYGGNWQSGRRQDYRFVADTLMTQGVDVVVPDYRLFPAVGFSEILADTVAAVRLVMTRSADRPVILMGHSAGAQLAALVALNVAHEIPDRHRILGFVGLAGPYDFYPFTEDSHWQIFAPVAEYPQSQPVNFVRADAPPLYLLHGAEDRRVRRGHSKSLMEKQQQAGGRASREVYPGMGHADIVVAFSRLHRARHTVAADVARFIAQTTGARVSASGVDD